MKNNYFTRSTPPYPMFIMFIAFLLMVPNLLPAQTVSDQMRANLATLKQENQTLKEKIAQYEEQIKLLQEENKDLQQELDLLTRKDKEEVKDQANQVVVNGIPCANVPRPQVEWHANVTRYLASIAVCSTIENPLQKKEREAAIKAEMDKLFRQIRLQTNWFGSLKELKQTDSREDDPSMYTLTISSEINGQIVLSGMDFDITKNSRLYDQLKKISTGQMVCFRAQTSKYETKTLTLSYEISPTPRSVEQRTYFHISTVIRAC